MTLILTLFLAFFFPKNTFAADEFNTNQITKYQIDAMGNAMVSKQIEITNNFSQIYAKEYEILNYYETPRIFRLYGIQYKIDPTLSSHFAQYMSTGSKSARSV